MITHNQYEVGWVIGVIDTSASISATPNLLPRIILKSSDRALVTRFADFFGTQLLGPYSAHPKSLGRKEVYATTVNGIDSTHFLMEHGWLLSKRQKTRLKNTFHMEPPEKPG